MFALTWKILVGVLPPKTGDFNMKLLLKLRQTFSSSMNRISNPFRNHNDAVKEENFPQYHSQVLGIFILTLK